MTSASIVHRTRPAAGAPEGALVLFHGRGADENDLFPVLDILDPERRLIGVTPRGPLSLPPGGAHWYAVKRVGYPDEATFLPTFAAAASWLDAFLSEAGIDAGRVILGGFSQGGVIAYSLGLGQGRPRPAALTAFSSFIPTVPGFSLDLGNAAELPVAIGHGELDPVIEVGWGREARSLLGEHGAVITYRESRMGHTIDPSFLAEVRVVIEKALRPSG
ncbi:MAG: phospholipase [Actinomycetota bacterium]|nr:phospholipase [Actinomycetota bacterium]